MTDRSLRLDANGHPHIAYGGDFLYYGWYDGTQWQIETVDTSEGVGSYASLALDANGTPHISYYDTTNHHLKYARKTESGWTIQTVDDTYVNYSSTSIAVGQDGNPRIAYNVRNDGFMYALKYARWTGATWDMRTIDESEGPKNSISFALDKNGNPHISYNSNSSLKYATWTGTSWGTQIIVDRASYLGSTSLALDSNDTPHIAYIHSNFLKYATWTGSSWEIKNVDYGFDLAGSYNSLALDVNNNPHISYFTPDIDVTVGTGRDLKYARWTENGWELRTLDTDGNVGHWNSIALDNNNNPNITYFNYDTGFIKYIRQTANGWETQIIDKAGKAGLYPSLALDQSDHPHISYLDTTYGELKFARWTGSEWNKQVVDGSSFTGYFTSLVLDSHGHPHISYFDLIYGVLRYARWTGTDWELQTVDGPGEISYYAVGWYPSLALDGNDNPHISYFDENGTSVKYAHWTGTGWDIQIVDQTNALYTKNTSLALDSKNHPHIVYQNSPTINYARWTGSNWDIQTVDYAEYGVWSSSLALDISDNAHIAYCNYHPIGHPLQLRYASWTGSGWDIQVVDYDEDWYKGLGWHSSLFLDSRGNPHISYYDYTNGNLKYARWTGLAWDIQTVDNGVDVGMYTSLFLDGNGNPHIAYYDNYLGDLKYAKGTLVGPDISVAPSKTNFNNVFVGNSQDQTITIRNDGVANLIVGTIELPSFPFAIVGGTCTDGITLAPNVSCSIIVRFAPTTPGPFSSNLTIPSNDGDENPVNIKLIGTGVAILPYRIMSIPEGLQINVDGTSYTTPLTINWPTGSTHTIEALSPQAESAGSRFVFSFWSDSGAQNHTILTPYSSVTYTANFELQYSLTTSVTPPGVSTVDPPGTTWHDENKFAYVYALTNNLNYHFSHWSGDISGTANPSRFIMDGPKNVIANFIGTPPETVSTPAVPGGANAGHTGISYAYSTADSFSNLLHPVEYQFDWKGDGSTDLSPWGLPNQSKTWTVTGTYHIRARARCATHTQVISSWSSPLYVNISDEILLLTPNNSETFSSCSLINGYQLPFTWTSKGIFAGYSILFSTSATDFENPITKSYILKTKYQWTSLSFVWKKLLSSSSQSGEIYWKVVGNKSDGTKVQSETRSFRIGNPQPVSINSPSEGANLPSNTLPTFNFNSNCNIKFKLEISSLGDFSDPMKIKAFNYTTRDPNVETTLNKTLTSFQWSTVKKLIGTGTGYFRIKAWDGINRGTVSEVRSFTIQ